MVLSQGLLEPGAQAHRQGGLRQEIAGDVGTHPAQTIGGEPAAGHDAMNVRMKAQITGPGLKHCQQAQFGAEVFVVTADVAQSAGAVLEQERIEDFLVGADEGAQLGGDGEGDQIIGEGQESAALSVQPRGGIGVTALRTGPMIARVVGKEELAAIAAEQLTAQRRSTATDNGGDGASMRTEQTGAKLPLIRRPVPAQNL